MSTTASSAKRGGGGGAGGRATNDARNGAPNGKSASSKGVAVPRPRTPVMVEIDAEARDARDAKPIPDVQASSDTRRIAIDRVGVKDVTYPIRLRIPESHRLPGGGPGNDEQTTVATINMYVSLPHYQKGTHMSRFLEVLNEHAAQNGPISPDDIPRITRAIRERLGAEEAHFLATFTYFISKKAPVTGARGMMDYRVTFECTSKRPAAQSKGKHAAAVNRAESDDHSNDFDDFDDFIMAVRAPATSLCPCSKEISAYGAHNQRCLIEAKVRFDPAKGPLWIECLAEIVEKAASCPVYAVLKRPDEKFVTEAAFDNPKFVEDIIRDLALALDREDRITWYSINSENFESIHNHNAYAEITRNKRG